MSTDKKPWELENAPTTLTPAEKAAATRKANKEAADAELAAKNSLGEPSLDSDPETEHTNDVVETFVPTESDLASLMGKLADKGVSPTELRTRAEEQYIDDSIPEQVYAFMQAELDAFKPVVAPLSEQAPLALVNLVSQGKSMKEAKKLLGIK